MKKLLLFPCLFISFFSFAEKNPSGSFSFTENKGQIVDQNYSARPEVLYLLSSPNFKLQLKKNNFSYEVIKIKEWKEPRKDTLLRKDSLIRRSFYSHRVDIDLIGANPRPQVIAEDKSNYYNNYYLNYLPVKNVERVYSYNKIMYKNIYPNIDMVFYSGAANAKYEFIVHPGGNPASIKLKYNGANKLSLQNGKMIIETAYGNVEEDVPVCYTELQGKNISVSSHFKLADNILSFELGGYDKSKTLVIDPHLMWGTYAGANSNEKDMTTDIFGNIFVTGQSLGGDYIVTAGAYQTVFAGVQDAFCAKFNYNGFLKWGTYYGWNDLDRGLAITCDKNGSAIITGDKDYNYQKFIAKFDSAGVFKWGNDIPCAGPSMDITTDKNDNIIVTGWISGSSCPGFSLNAFQPVYAGNSDAFLSKYDSSGTLLWATFYGGSSIDRGYGVATDTTGNIIMCGIATSSNPNVIATPGSYISTYNNNSTFLAKFDSSGNRLWGTYFGSSNILAFKVALDSAENIYMSGTAVSPGGIATAGAHQMVINGDEDSFLVKFDSLGFPIWGTYYGGNNSEGNNSGPLSAALIVDPAGNTYLSGITESLNAISSFGTHQTQFAGSIDTYLAKFNSAGVRQWATYYGGNLDDVVGGIAFDTIGNVVIAGYTNSPTGIATPGAFQTSGGNGSTYIAKFCANPVLILNQTQSQQVCLGTTTVLSVNVGGAGPFTYQWQKDSVNIAGTLSSYTITSTSFADTGVYTCYVTSPYCDATTVPIVLSVTNQPPQIISNSSSQTICAGQTAVLSVNINGPVSYQWQQDSVNIPGAINNNLILSPVQLADSGNYLCIVSNACGADTSSAANLIVNPSPTANAGSNQTICAGKTATICGTASIGATQYQWYQTPVWTQISSNACTSVSPISTSDYVLIVQNAYCSDTDMVTVFVNSLPSANAGNDVSICSGSNTPLNGTGGISCSWIPSTGLTNPNSCFPSAWLTSSVTYTLTVTNSNGCTASDAVLVFVDPCTSIKDLDNNISISVYPNPFTDETTISFSQPLYNAKLFLYNMIGDKAVLEKEINGDKITIRKGSLPAGIYFVKIHSGDTVYTEKVLVR